MLNIWLTKFEKILYDSHVCINNKNEHPMSQTPLI